jgi:hypothetical protein
VADRQQEREVGERAKRETKGARVVSQTDAQSEAQSEATHPQFAPGAAAFAGFITSVTSPPRGAIRVIPTLRAAEDPPHKDLAPKRARPR